MKRGTPRHPKMKALARSLNIPQAYAVGIMETLWHFAGEFAPRGDIGRVKDEAIADAIGWKKSASLLVTSLTTTGWLDSNPKYRLIIHDWPEHCDDAVRKKLVRAKVDFLEVYQSKETRADKLSVETPSGHSPDSGGPSRAVGRGKASGSFEVSKETSLPSEKVVALQPSERSAMRDGWAAFRERWPVLTKRDQRIQQAENAWFAKVTPATVDPALACLERYGVSDEVSRGVVCNPDKWIYDQADNDWKGTWPPARASPKSKRDELIAHRNEVAEIAKFIGGVGGVK